MKEHLGSPDKKARWSQDQDEKGHKKRSKGRGLVLSAMAAAALVVAESKPAGTSAEIDQVTISAPVTPVTEPETTKEIKVDFESVIADTQRYLRSDGFENLFKGEGRVSFSHVIEALERANDLPESEEFSRYIKEIRNLYPVQIAFSKDKLLFLPTTIDSSRDSFMDEGKYGNGVYWENANTIVTVDHLIEHVIEGSELKDNLPRYSTDIALVSVPDEFAAKDERQIIHDDSNLKNSDIEGSLVSIVGIDPDATSNPDTGRKAISGFAVKVRPNMARVLARGNSFLEELYKKAFMVVLPEEETNKDPRDSKGKPMIAGMSGSPVFTQRNGKNVFCGILGEITGVYNEVKGRNVQVALFFGIEEVRKGTFENPIYKVE